MSGVAGSDPRWKELLSSLHQLHATIPEEPSQPPRKFLEELKKQRSDYLFKREYVDESLEPGTPMHEFREEHQYSRELVNALDALGNLKQEGGRANQIKNGWKHLWDYERKRDWDRILIPGLELVRDTSTWTFTEIVQFIFDELNPILLPTLVTTSSELYRSIAQHGVVENAIQSRRDEVLKGLEEMAWKKYVRIVIRDDAGNELYADQLIARHFQISNVIEINGVGGLGKTALMYEFLRNHLQKKYKSLHQFDHIIILTGKGEEQGEIDTTSHTNEGLVTTSPMDPRHGPRSFVSKLNFNDVIKIINSYGVVGAKLGNVENAIKTFSEGNMILVLDNFEDCTSEDRRKFTNFFQHRNVSGAPHSRIIVTGRDTTEFNVPKIKLPRLTPEESQQLFRARYDYMWSISHELESEWFGQNRILDELRAADYPERFVSMCQRRENAEFREMIGHPLFIFHLTTLLGDKSLVKSHEHSAVDDNSSHGEFDLTRVLQRMIDNPELELNKYHHELYDWIVGKAYTDVENDPVAVFLLGELMAAGGLTDGDLRRAIRETGRQEWDPVDHYKPAMARLKKHDIFIEEAKTVEGETRYQLRPEGARYLLQSPAFPASRENAADRGSPSIVERELIHWLREIITAASDGAAELASLCEKFVENTVEVPLSRRKNLSLQTYRLIVTTSTAIEEENARIAWQPIHSQAIEAIVSILESQHQINEHRSQMMSFLHELLLKCSATSTEDMWFVVNRSSALQWFRPDTLTNGKGAMLRHRIIEMLPSKNRTLEEWCAWLPFLDLTPVGEALTATEWGRLKVLLMDDHERLEALVSERRGTADGLGLQHAASFLKFQASFDEEWSKSTFSLLSIFDAFPTETSWSTIHAWHRYTRPPRVPNDLEVLPNGWTAPSGLSFDHAGIDRPVFVDVGTAYETYRENKTTTSNDDTVVLKTEFLDLMVRFSIDWMLSNAPQDGVLVLEPLHHVLGKQFNAPNGINKFLALHSAGEYNSIKDWIQERVIHDAVFVENFTFQQSGHFGLVARIPKGTESSGSEPISNEDLEQIFTNVCPQFPSVDETLTIVLEFRSWIENKATVSSNVTGIGNEFKKHCQERGFAKPNHVNVAFGLARNLSTQRIINVQHILRALQAHGEHRINEKNEQHEARRPELKEKFRVYLGQVRLRLNDDLFTIHRPTRTITPSLPSLLAIQPSRQRKGRKGTPAPAPRRGPVRAPATPQQIFDEWIRICVQEFPDVDLYKHLKSAHTNLYPFKFQSSDHFIHEHPAMSSERMGMIEAYLEQCKKDELDPTLYDLRAFIED